MEAVRHVCQPIRQVHRDRVRESLPALLGAADGVGEQHPSRVRGRVGRRSDQDDRAPPGRQRRRGQGQVHAHHSRGRLRLHEEAPRRGAALILELGAHLRQDPRLVAAPHPADQGGVSRPGPHRLDHGRLRQRQGAAELAAPRPRLPGRRGGRARAQLLLSPHGPARHGVQHRQGRGALLGGDRGGEGSGHGAGLVQAHARHGGDRSRGGGLLPRAAPTRSSPPTPSLRSR